MKDETEKIFCIGFHKTGTTSLAAALEQLRYKVKHGNKPQSDQIETALQHGKLALSIVQAQLGEFDAWADLYAVRRHYAVLDQQYPNARFILTVRDSEQWIESCKRQRERRADSPYFHYWYYQTEDQWAVEKMTHEWLVRSYFAERSNKLLVMNITEGDG